MTRARPRSPTPTGPRTAVISVLIALPTCAVFCILLGLARMAGAATGLALAVGAALTLLPAHGIAALASQALPARSPATLAAAASWLWALAVVGVTPAFVPGDGLEARFEALARAVLGGPAAPHTVAEPLSARVTAPTPPDAPAIEPAPEPRAIAPRATAPTTRPEPEAAEAVVLAYRGDGRELDVEVALDGPDFGERFRMIFDTGASFTTVTPTALAEIDVAIPADAPRVTLNTAGGQIQAPLVLLDAVWMGDVPIEWVTVAACPSCTAPGRAGLLGLNVSSQFRVEIDHDRRRIHLTPSPGDRRHDIRPWLALSARGIRHRQHGQERLEFDVTVTNQAPRAIESGTVEIDCGDSGYAVELTGIPAHGEQTTSLTLPGAERCESFELDLLSARWVLDRF